MYYVHLQVSIVSVLRKPNLMSRIKAVATKSRTIFSVVLNTPPMAYLRAYIRCRPTKVRYRLHYTTVTVVHTYWHILRSTWLVLRFCFYGNDLREHCNRPVSGKVGMCTSMCIKTRESSQRCFCRHLAIVNYFQPRGGVHNRQQSCGKKTKTIEIQKRKPTRRASLRFERNRQRNGTCQIAGFLRRFI